MSAEPASKIYVAVVDDDEGLRRSFSRLLRAAGYEPVGYDSAEKFFADRNRPQFDCLVLDIQLGGVSGLELHRQLTSLGSRTPVIFLTAHDDPKARAQAQAIGCAAYFRKTEPGQTVLNAIRRAVADTDPLPDATTNILE